MAFMNPILIKTHDTIVDLTSATAAQFQFVKFSSGNIVLCSSQGEPCYGVLQNKPLGATGAAKGADIMVMGISTVRAGATLVAGDRVTPTAVGKADLAATGDYVCGTALAAAADGDLVPVLLTINGYVVP